ncbi:MAG: hypothetical protein FGM35_01795 [Rhodocyclaceae bacterium]|nr:hypothetical protein [Rhodocyclaceae bacterium]
MTNQATKCFTKWVGDQSVDRWALFTLEFPRFTKVELWESPVRAAFKQLEKSYPKSGYKKHRVRTGVPVLNYVTILGGDRTGGVALHAQGLVEVLDDPELTRLTLKMESAWKSAVTRQIRHLGCDSSDINMNEVKVWVRELDSDPSNYLAYLNRYEGHDLGFGVNKVMLSATMLTH